MLTINNKIYSAEPGVYVGKKDSGDRRRFYSASFYFIILFYFYANAFLMLFHSHKRTKENKAHINKLAVITHK